MAKQTIEFTKGKWEKSLIYAHSYRWTETPVVIQEEDCVVNAVNPDTEQGFDNISLMTREKYGVGTKLTTTCSFEKTAAPLFVIADKYYENEDGVLKYGDYLEIVIWKYGLNVWQMYMEDGIVKWNQLLGVEFPLTEDEKHTMSVEILDEAIRMEVEGRVFLLRVENLNQTYHVGVNMCEGITRFYDFTIEDNT